MTPRPARGVHGPHRRHQSGHGVVVRLLIAICCVLLALPAGLAGADPTTGPLNADNKPAVKVKVTKIQPSAGTPDAMITISGTITNITAGTLVDLSVRIQRDSRQSTRAGLRAAELNPPAYDADVAQFQSLPGDLNPGRTIEFTVTASIEDLGMQDAGVYPLLVNVNGEGEGQERRVGQAATMMPYFPGTPTAAVGIGWIWPLIDRPHRSVNASRFLDDDLSASIAIGGRLDRMLTLAEKYGKEAKMTIVVDPDLISELDVMQAGYQVAIPAINGNPASKPGIGQRAAKEWLDRLRTLVQDVPIATVAFGDVDVVSMQRAGLGTEIAPARKTGTKVVDDVLQVNSISSIDWPVNGALTDAGRDIDIAAGVDTFILGGAAFNQPTFLTSADGVTESPATILPGGEGASALALDPTLSGIVAEGETYAAGSALATQRFIAELAAIHGEAPSRSRSVLIAPPRRWSPPPGFAASLLALSSNTPWLTPASLTEIRQSPPVERGPLAYATVTSLQEIASASLEPLNAALADANDLRSSMTPADATAMLGQFQQAIWRAGSSANRTARKALVERVKEISLALSAMRLDVQIIPPSNGTYTLSAADSPLVFTVENKLLVPIKFKLSVGGTTAGLTAQDIGVKEVPKRSRLTVTVPSTVQRSGTFQIIAKISTPNGQALGNPGGQEITVRSTAYGTAALIVTGVAFTMLLLLVGRRGVRRIKLRRAGGPPVSTEIPFDPDQPVPIATQR